MKKPGQARAEVEMKMHFDSILQKYVLYVNQDTAGWLGYDRN